MMIEALFFYAFSSILVLAAAGVVFFKNPVHAALSLVAAFFVSACLWLMLQAEFLALILILVYVGAVMTLFLFVVMTIDLDVDIQKQTFVRYFPLGLLLIFVLGGILIVAMKPIPYLLPSELLSLSDNFSNVKALGEVLYTTYAYPFLLAAVLLLIAIIAAISLNPHVTRKRKTQEIDEQVDIQRDKRLKMVKMETEKYL